MASQADALSPPAPALRFQPIFFFGSMMTVIGVAIDLVKTYQWYLVSAIFAGYFAKSYIEYRRLKAFNGPWLAGWTDLWFAKAAFGINQCGVLAEACEKYGPVARIGPNTLVTTSPELIMRMSAARSPYTRGDWYAASRIPPGQDNIFTQQDDEKHNRRKAQMADGFSAKTNPSLEPTIDVHVQGLLDLLRRKYMSTPDSFKPVDMARKAAFFTMDVITDLAFAKPFGNLKNDRDTYNYIKSTEDLVPTVLRISSIPALKSFFEMDWVNKALFPSDTSENGLGRVVGIAKKLASDRYASKNVDHQDMLSSFIAHGLTESDLVTESVMQILAGAETTATALRATLLHTITNARIYSTLQTEVDEAIKAGKVSSPVVKDTEWRHQVYLQAVIKEGLRFWPPVTGLMTKFSPPSGDEVEVDGEKMFIPGGTDIGWASNGIHRNKAVFGDDVNLFRPERWMEDGNVDRERLEKMRKVVDLNFGYGKYYCLGRSIALSELHKATFELFRNFDLEIVHPSRPWKSENVGLWMQSEMWVRVTERKAA